MSDLESVSGCFGDFGHPCCENKCETCTARGLCQHTSRHFVKKAEIKRDLERIEKIIRGE